MNMLCSKCNERMAVLFVAHMEDGEMKNSGLCLKCAREMTIPQIQEIMDKMGLTDDDVEAMSEQMTELLGDENFDLQGELGAAAEQFPFLKNIFPNSEDGSEGITEADSNEDIVARFSDNRSQDDAAVVNEDKKEQPRRKRKFLDNFCENLTQKASEDKIDRIIGRDKEIHRVMQILNRRTKNNPVLIGEPGVGKTAIAEGIAQRLLRSDAPPRLADKEIHLLDLTALVAGTQFRGQFESRMKGLINEVKEAGNIILFIDEVHNIVGAGDSEGSMNTANILKPALSRGEIQVIGATTFNEYRKYIEKDAALERRFQPVRVDEPSIDETIEVLRGIKNYYEDYHRVRVPDNVIHDCVVYSERYITDRFLPDKAIDLLDEACSAATLKNKSLAKYDDLQKKLNVLEDQERDYENDLADLSETDYKHLAEIRVEKMRMTDQLKELKPKALNRIITPDDLAGVLELWTGIPATTIKETELKKVATLETALKKRIIGQDEAVEMVAAAVRRSRVQISDRRRPASFIFVGPTGVGKTELVKVLAEEMFDKKTDPLIRLDMSEFMEKHAVSRIIGSPPGYVGFDEAGQLTEKVRRRPYSVVLFDEIEKAHPDIMNILLQILDEGRITDAQGRDINFENTIIVMTSNAGSSVKSINVGFNVKEEQADKEKSRKALSQFLRPEFLGRVDEIVTFRQLGKEDFERIAALMLDELVGPLDHRGITFKYKPEALSVIAEKAYGKESGARDLRRVIRKEVEDNIANLLLDNPDNPPSIIELAAKDGTLHLSASGLLQLTPPVTNKTN